MTNISNWNNGRISKILQFYKKKFTKLSKLLKIVKFWNISNLFQLICHKTSFIYLIR